MRKLVLLLILCMSGQQSYAQTPDEKLPLARRIVALLAFDSQFEAQIAACSASAPGTGLDPLFEFQRNPAYFGGVSPQSAYWPEIELAYQQYRRRVCSYMSVSEFVEYCANEYASRTTLEELQAAIQFYDSPAGRAFLKANAQVGVAIQRDLVRRMREVTSREDPAVRTELERIVDAYKRAPR